MKLKSNIPLCNTLSIYCNELTVLTLYYTVDELTLYSTAV